MLEMRNHREHKSSCPMSPLHQRRSGLALLESIVAAGILVFTVTALYTLYGYSRNQLADINETSAAQSYLQSRLDQLRGLGWNGVRDPAYLQSVLSGTSRASRSILDLIPSMSREPFVSGTFREYIRVYPASVPASSPLPSPTPSATPTPGSTPLFTVTLTVTSSGTNVVYSPSPTPTSSEVYLLRYNLGIEWRNRNRTKTRELTTLLSRSGSP